MKPNQISKNQIALISIISGLIGAALQIVVSIFLKEGLWVISTYTLVMLATFIFVWSKKYTDISFKKWFIIGTLTFTVMSYVLVAYVLIYANPGARQIPFLGQLWRFGFIVGCGALCSAVLGLFFIKRNPASLQVS